MMMDKLNYMERMLDEIERDIKLHEDPTIHVSDDISKRNIDNSFEKIKQIYKELRSIIVELKNGYYNMSTE